MFDNEYQLNEGLGDWLRKLADKGDKVDKKAAELKQAAQDKIKKMSDDAKTAIENVKAKAGESWDKVKDTYTAAVATIDDALQNAKTSVEDVVKGAGIKMADFMATSAQVLSNLYAQGKEKLANSFKDTKTAAAMQALLLGAILCKNNNIDSSQVLLLFLRKNPDIPHRSVISECYIPDRNRKNTSGFCVFRAIQQPH